MVKLRYLGQNYISFGSHKIVNGFNEIADDDFYQLMNYPTFAARVKSRVFSVPADFPLVKPQDEKPAKKEKDLEEKSNDEESEDKNSLSQRDLLKEIAKSEDAQYLKDLLESDKRPKVLNALEKRLEELQEAKKEEAKG